LSWKPLLEIEKELAKQRKLPTLKQGDKLPDTQNFGECGEALELFAEKIGSSPETVRQALWLTENAPEEELEKPGNPCRFFGKREGESY